VRLALTVLHVPTGRRADRSVVVDPDATVAEVAAHLATALGLPADAREYGAPAAVLRALGVRSARLLTNNPEKEAGVAEHGVVVRGRVPLVVPAGAEAARYLAVKRDRMGHLLPLHGLVGA